MNSLLAWIVIMQVTHACPVRAIEMSAAISGISLMASEPARLFIDKMVLPCPLVDASCLRCSPCQPADTLATDTSYLACAECCRGPAVESRIATIGKEAKTHASPN
mgnify:CR=1 FL=1